MTGVMMNDKNKEMRIVVFIAIALVIFMLVNLVWALGIE